MNLYTTLCGFYMELLNFRHLKTKTCLINWSSTTHTLLASAGLKIASLVSSLNLFNNAFLREESNGLSYKFHFLAISLNCGFQKKLGIAGADLRPDTLPPYFSTTQMLPTIILQFLLDRCLLLKSSVFVHKTNPTYGTNLRSQCTLFR